MKNWLNNDTASDGIVINTSMSFGRNFVHSKFTDKLKDDEARNNITSVYNIVSNKIKDDIKLIRLSELDKDAMKVYRDKQIIDDSLIQRKDKAAFIVNNNETLSVMINEEENLRIQCTVDEIDLENQFEYINKIDDYIGEDMSYAFSNEYGYISSNPINLGTGMKVSVLLHLPGLSASKEIKEISGQLKKAGVIVEGAYGEKSKPIGHMYRIYNKSLIGENEKQIINNMEEAVYNIISDEKEYRHTMLLNNRQEIEDRIFRAYGILTNARILKQDEALELLSDLRLGSEFGLLNINKKVLNNILVKSQDSFINFQIGAEKEELDKDIIRAKVVRELLNEER